MPTVKSIIHPFIDKLKIYFCARNVIIIFLPFSCFAQFGANNEFYENKSYFSINKLYDARERHRGGNTIVVTKSGALLAFHDKFIRRSIDGGENWSNPSDIGVEANKFGVTLDEVNGNLLIINSDGRNLVSSDEGWNWVAQNSIISPNLFGHGSSNNKDLDMGAMQPGITLQFGKNKGRLLMPVRWVPSNSLKWRPYIYNSAIYSDDRGATWQTSMPFPVLGTGEAALTEISSGRILYSSREHMSQGNRFFAWSYDGGDHWVDFWRSNILPDGPRGTSYGCMGGLVRLPVDGVNILIYSNLDTNDGVMPSKKMAGESKDSDRKNISVWASFDGGETWPVVRSIFKGPSAYSTLAVGRKNTSSEGFIYIFFEGGDKGMYSSIHLAKFNLKWLMDGVLTGDGFIPIDLNNPKF